MNKKIIKLIVVILLVIFVVDFIYPINISYAEDITKSEIKNSKKEDKDIKPSDDFYKNLLFSGTSKMKQDSAPEPIGAGQAILMLIPNIFIMIGKVFGIVIDKMISTFVNEKVVNYPGTDNNDFINKEEYTKNFTLDKLFFGDIELLNANFFDFDSNKTDLNTLIKVNVAKWYVVMAGIAIILLLRSNDIFGYKYDFSLCRVKNSSKTCKYKKYDDKCCYIFYYGFYITFYTSNDYWFK